MRSTTRAALHWLVLGLAVALVYEWTAQRGRGAAEAVGAR